jgi:alpha-amylase
MQSFSFHATSTTGLYLEASSIGMQQETALNAHCMSSLVLFAGEFVKEYCECSEPHFVVGEYWDSLDYDHGTAKHNQDAHRQRIIDWINAAGDQATAFDVTTKGILCASTLMLYIHSRL